MELKDERYRLAVLVSWSASCTSIDISTPKTKTPAEAGRRAFLNET